MTNNLEKSMKERLDAWRERSKPDFKPKERGDNMRDYERQEKAMWEQEKLNNPMYTRRRS